MKGKKLLVMLAAVIAISGTGYTAGVNITSAYGLTSDESSVETDDEVTENIGVTANSESEESASVNVKVEYAYESAANCFDPIITVTNNSDEELDLKDLQINYYYVSQSNTGETFICYYGGTIDGDYENLTSYVNGFITDVDYPDYAAPDLGDNLGDSSTDGNTYSAGSMQSVKMQPDKCAALNFNGGTLKSGQSMRLQCDIHKDNWSNYEYTDKSLCVTNAYVNDKLVYGKSIYDNSRFDYYKKNFNPELLSNQINYISGYATDASVQLKLNGCEFAGITDVSCDKELTEGKDYTVKCDDPESDLYTITIKQDYIMNVSCYDYINFKVNFVDRDSQDFNLYFMQPQDIHGMLPDFENGEGTYYNPYADLVMPELSKDKFYFEEGFDWESSGYNQVKLTLNGNTFEGIEGLTEGKDYTFEDNIISFKEDSIKEYFKDFADEQDFYLKFSNNIKKTLTIKNILCGIPEYFNASVGNGDVDTERDSLIMIPIEISHNVGDILTQCSFDLKYDSNVFRKAYIVCDDKNVVSETDRENGIVSVTYDKHDSTLSGAEASEEVYGPQLKMNLVLITDSDAPFGDTKVGFESKGFTARNDIDYTVTVARNKINIKNK